MIRVFKLGVLHVMILRAPFVISALLLPAFIQYSTYGATPFRDRPPKARLVKQRNQARVQLGLQLVHTELNKLHPLLLDFCKSCTPKAVSMSLLLDHRPSLLSISFTCAGIPSLTRRRIDPLTSSWESSTNFGEVQSISLPSKTCFWQSSSI